RPRRLRGLHLPRRRRHPGLPGLPAADPRGGQRPVPGELSPRLPAVIRASDADRNAVAEQLGVHYADGRLDQAEFDERISRTMAAKTRGDLSGLFDDLPDPGSAGAPGTSGPGGPAPYVRPRRRSGAFR